MGTPKFSLLAFSTALALAPPAIAESEWYVDAELTRYQTDDSEEQRSLWAKNVTISYYPEDLGVGFYAYAYHDEEFQGAYIGVSKSVGDVEFGLGVGPAEYDDETWTVLNPWLYYDDQLYQASVWVEYVDDDVGNNKWFYKYHLQRSLDHQWFAGLYGERLLGLGPLLGFNLTDELSVWITVPVADLPDEGKMVGLATLAYSW